MEEEMIQAFSAHNEDKKYIKNFGWQNWKEELGVDWR
jgi:hypothetical protein